MWPRNALTGRLDLQAPIIQGPFGSGLSSVDLVVAVCESGGLGSFGVHHLPAAGIHDIAAQIRTRTNRGFALNLWVPMEQSEEPPLTDAQFEAAIALLRPWYEELGVPLPVRPQRFSPPFSEQLEAVLEARPAVFSFVFGIPDADVLRRCRERGIFTMGAATTVDEALALEASGVDAVVASGFEAGGHRISFLKPAEECLTGTIALVPQVADAVRVPVIAAGGIADRRGVAAVLQLGAQAAQIGSAFLACRESNASALHKQRLRGGDAKDTVLTRAFTGRLARGLRNAFTEALRPHADRLPPYPVQAWMTAQFRQAAIAQGRADLLPLWAGQSAGLIRHDGARELMRWLTEE